MSGKRNQNNFSKEDYTERFETDFKGSKEDEDEFMSSTYEFDESGEYATPLKQEQLFNIVLKFTTLSEANSEAPSFFVNSSGAKIGRDSSNEINIPSDGRLTHVAHSLIQYSEGKFYLLDCGNDFAASIRIGMGGNKRKWIVEEGCQFSAGEKPYYDRHYFCDLCMYGFIKK